MDYLQRARRQPKVLIDLELTGAMRTSENAVSTHSRNAAQPRPDRTRTAGEGASCSRGIMAYCARTSGGHYLGLRVRSGDA